MVLKIRLLGHVFEQNKNSISDLIGLILEMSLILKGNYIRIYKVVRIGNFNY